VILPPLFRLKFLVAVGVGVGVHPLLQKEAAEAVHTHHQTLSPVCLREELHTSTLVLPVPQERLVETARLVEIHGSTQQPIRPQRLVPTVH
jgi:hypothetical protein